MKFHDSFLDEIRNRVSVSDVVSRRVKLQRRGREFIGLSPFKQEKTPSFTVNDQKGFYHCFASGEHGDIFKFVQVTEGLSFPEAVERLAVVAGIELPKPDPAYERFEKKRTSLFEVMDRARVFFEQNLRSSKGREAIEYARGRGLSDETLNEFHFGYAGGARNELKDALLKKGISEEQLLECGLVIKPDDGRPSYDRFRDRLVIPIQDSRGNVIAFGGRALREDVTPKYLNSPETTLFNKGSVVFNFHRARGSAFEANEIIVVEGYLDAIAVYQAGIRNVVATLGTAFTERQFGLLWRLSDEPIICFDGDRAGVAAANRAIDRMLPELSAGKSFRFVVLPEGSDPDDLVRSGEVSRFRTFLENAKPLADVMWNREVASARLDTPERKAAFEANIKKLVDTVRSEPVHREYARSFRIRMFHLFWEIDRSTSGDVREDRSLILGEIKRTGSNIERIFLGLLVHYPLIFERLLEPVERLTFASDSYTRFRDELIRIMRLPDDIEVATFYEEISDEFFELLEFVHGNESKTRAYGYNLFIRYPTLRLSPPDDFVEKSADFFLRILEHEAARRELPEVLHEYEIEQNEEIEARLVHLVNSIEEYELESAQQERELDEWASTLRSTFNRTYKKSIGEVVSEVHGAAS